MEPEGYFLVEPDCILGRREITLRNRTIGQVKVQWKHLSLEEASFHIFVLKKHVHDATHVINWNDVQV